MRCTTLYMLFDQKGTLLYVGITGSGMDRMHAHSKDKSWWPLVRRSEFVHFATREQALAVEEATIIGRRPLFNIDMNPHPVALDDIVIPDLETADLVVRAAKRCANVACGVLISGKAKRGRCSTCYRYCLRHNGNDRPRELIENPLPDVTQKRATEKSSRQ